MDTVQLTKVRLNGRNEYTGYIIPGECPGWDYRRGTNARHDIHLYRPYFSQCYNRHIPIFEYDRVEVLHSQAVSLCL